MARKELSYGRMDERDLRQLSEEVYVTPCLSPDSSCRAEAHALLSLRNILQELSNNDNIVRYYERYVDKEEQKLYVCMQFCENGDLGGVISRCRKDK